MSVFVKKYLFATRSTPKPLSTMQQRWATLPGYKKLRENQRKFQVDDGCPIHLKRGLPDKVCYWATLALCLLGLGLDFKLYYNLMFPKQQVAEEED